MTPDIYQPDGQIPTLIHTQEGNGFPAEKEQLKTHAVIFDLDSTLVTIEGIDELARLRGVAHHVSEMTTRAMNGEIPFAEVFFKRLDIIKPHHDDLVRVGELYCETLTQGAIEVVRKLQDRNITIFIVSGGYNPAVRMVARKLGIPDCNVFANELVFDEHGEYQGVNLAVPLWKNDGKKHIISSLKDRFPGNYVFVGDSMSDLEAGELTDKFICFAGVATRQSVIAKAEIAITNPNLTAILEHI